MQSPPPLSPASPIPVPDIGIGEPVAVIPAASVAPLDGEPDGDRINTFLLAPKERTSMGAFAESTVAEVRSRVTAKPFTYLAAAFSLGYVIARAMR
ncbi:MAG: hypothetical protein K0S57_3417 [Ramlibacter sp.]|jgi:hypothetical protein|nr:hypothetical protein [Ramlibacter sp.]